MKEKLCDSLLGRKFPFTWLKSRASESQEGLGLVSGRERRDPCPRAGLEPQCCAFCLSKRIE